MIRLLWVGPLAVLLSTAAVIVAQRLVAGVLRRALTLSGLNRVQIDLLSSSNEPAFFTAVLVSIAVVVFAVVQREAVTPCPTYRRIAFAALLISLIPDVLAGLGALFGWPLATAYMVLHVVAWAVSVTTLTRLAC